MARESIGRQEPPISQLAQKIFLLQAPHVIADSAVSRRLLAGLTLDLLLFLVEIVPFSAPGGGQTVHIVSGFFQQPIQGCAFV